MITIIVPFYNTEKYLEQCLVSIKDQTFSDFECLMIDDGSTDSSRKIAEKFTLDKRFVLLNDHHIGFPQAKNLGLDKAKGEYICFLDSDDFINSHYLEVLYKGLIKSGADICCCKYRSFKGKPIIQEEKSKLEVFSKDRMSKIFSPCTSFMWNKIYKRKIFDDMRFENVMALSDTMLCYKLFEKAHSVAYISKTLVYHRLHNESMTFNVRNFEPNYWEHRLNVYITMCSYLAKKYPQYQKMYKDIFKKDLKLLIGPHLSEKVYNEYMQKPEVQFLLSSEEN